MAPAPASVLAINGGSSSIKFAVYGAGTLPKPSVSGALDRIGRGGTTLSWRATEGASREGHTEVPDDTPATGLLLDWLEAREEFATVKAVGHRVSMGWHIRNRSELPLNCSTNCMAQRPMHRITYHARSR